MILTHASNKAIKYACLNFHYAKSIPVNTLGYNVFNSNNEWCGVVLFGKGANNNIGNEYNLLQGEICELVRVALNGKQECTSQAVAMSIKQLKKDCPLMKLIVSYADCDQQHLGTIYQATNWVYVGKKLENSTDSSWIINGKRIHGRAVSELVKSKGGLNGLTRKTFLQKYFDENAQEYITKGKLKYLMPLNKKMKSKIEPLQKPYPKNENWVKIDRTIFNNSDLHHTDKINSII